MNRKKKPYQYAVIRFAPFVETGEFANIGIVMFSPHTGELQYVLERKKTKRVTNFFSDLKVDFLRKSMESLSHELARISKMINQEAAGENYLGNKTHWDIASTRHLFKEITREREGAIQFSEPRTVLSFDMAKELKRTFSFYVHRNFVNNSYREAVLEKTLKTWLQETVGLPKFLKEQIGDETYKASFPFVAKGSRGFTGIIKPFFLGQEDSSKIIDHSIAWKGKLDQLEDYLPQKVLFTIEGPQGADRHKNLAYQEACAILQKSPKVALVPFSDRHAIIEYAKSAAELRS